MMRHNKGPNWIENPQNGDHGRRTSLLCISMEVPTRGGGDYRNNHDGSIIIVVHGSLMVPSPGLSVYL